MDAIRSSRSSTHSADKTFSDLAARAALAGFQLWRSDAGDGPQRYFAGKWGHVRVLGDLAEVEGFLQQVAPQRG